MTTAASRLLTQKAYELAQFQRFSAACHCVPTGEWDQPREPEPDLVVKSTGGHIGVELTELHPSSEASRRDEGEQDGSTGAALRLYEAAGHPPVAVSVMWNSHPSIAKLDRITFAQLLYNLIVTHLPPANDFRRVEGSEALGGRLPVECLTILRTDFHKSNFWSNARFGFVDPCRAADVQGRIELEDVKVARYGATYVSRWLVLVKGAAGPSTWGLVIDEVWQTPFRSRYDRVFLVEQDLGRCSELVVVPVGSTGGCHVDAG